MVYISNNGFIKLSRGDSFEVPLFINNGTKILPIRYCIASHPNATVYLGVMEPNQPFEEAIIRKTYNYKSKINSNGDLMISFTPEDTEYLYPGKYYYSIKIEHDGNNVDTIVPKTEFFIMD